MLMFRFLVCPPAKKTEEDNLLRYGQHGGATISEITSEKDVFFKALGVYWLLMIIDPDTTLDDVKKGFGRQG